jgi:hypothetical protein
MIMNKLEATELKPCRVCQHQVSMDAIICPSCGAPHPANHEWNGWGFEYKSKSSIMGLPWLHISFKYRPNKVPVVAMGVISIGQFGVGIINISQFGIGLFSLSQFTIAGYAVAQFTLAYSCIAQFGIYIDQGKGQIVKSLAQIIDPGM